MPDEILYVESKRAARAKRVQTAQHAFAAVLLAASGISHFAHDRWLSIAEIVAGALLFATILEEKVRHRRASHRRIASVEFAGAFLSFVDSIEKTRGPHHVSFIILTFAAPLLLFVFACIDTRGGVRRYIKVSDRGIEVRLRLLFSRKVRWHEIRGYRLLDDSIDLGGRALKLRDVVDCERAKEFLVAALQRRGVEELPA